jgi:16S rRNA (uracil1498-N3)-methyltransferase
MRDEDKASGDRTDQCGTGKIRLFVEPDLKAGLGVVPTRDQIHYLLNVMRLKDGDKIRVFNGRHGEWSAHLDAVTKRSCLLALDEQTREQDALPDIWLLFAPVKRARLDFIVQKAVEMGAGRILPVLTERTNVSRVKGDRLKANAMEAAEQCGLLAVPEVAEPQSLSRLLDAWGDEAPGRKIIFCDEAAAPGGALALLSSMKEGQGPLAVLIGPEGGFSPAERDRLLARDDTLPVSLGPRIMRADTAAIAALAAVQMVLGDWQ